MLPSKEPEETTGERRREARRARETTRMTKDKKTYYYDRYTGSKWEVEGDFTCEEVVSYIKKNWLDPHDKVIEDLNRRGILRELAVRYAHGEKHLVKRTAKARTEYTKPSPGFQSRVIDAIAFCNQCFQVSPLLATKSKSVRFNRHAETFGGLFF